MRQEVQVGRGGQVGQGGRAGRGRRCSIGRMLGALAVLVVLAVGCSGASADRAASRDAPSQAALAEGTVPASGAVEALQPNQALGVKRSVISTASLRVRVGDRSKAATQATQLVVRSGGTVFAQTADLQGAEDTTMTLKVPPAQFQKVLRALAALGTPLTRESQIEDVTEKVVDLDGRLRTMQASADRLRTLLADAPDIQGVVAIEGELAKREAEVESLEGQLRVIRAQVDQATIELALTERTDLQVNKDLPGVQASLHNGWTALRNATGAVVTVLAFLLPFLAVFVPLALVVRWRWRRRPRPVAGA